MRDINKTERILHLDIVDSTNDKLKELASEGAPEGQVLVADAQSKGKGRRGRSFASPKGKGIYFSYLLRPEKMSPELTNLTAWTAAAVYRALRTVCSVEAGIKWVNDLVLNKKKICGILTEMSMEGGEIRHVVIGIGINVNEDWEDFPEDVRDVATSLHIETGKVFSREELVQELVKELDRIRDVFSNSMDFEARKREWHSIYCSACVTTGKEVCVISGTSKRMAKALAVNEDFSLKVEYEDGTFENLSSGEVSVRGIEGYV